MAYISQSPAKSLFANFSEALGNFYFGLFNSIDLAASANKRLAQIEALSAKSDEELAELGIRREDIARHVFRDIYHF